MSDDQDGCEKVSVSSGTGLPGLSRTKGRQTVVCASRLWLGLRLGTGADDRGVSYIRHVRVSSVETRTAEALVVLRSAASHGLSLPR